MSDSLLMKDYLTSRTIATGKMVSNYRKLYYQTNEDLISLFFDVDFRGKDVLSVIGSGDQVLTSRLLDAKKTDAFDSNRLTIYYMYLRLWTIQYQNELYPQILDGNTWIKELLKKVKPRNEQERKALLFFQMHVQANTNFDHLFYDVSKQQEGKVLYNTPEELRDCLSPDLNIYIFDMFKKTNLPKNYDIVVVSNILEWARNKKHSLKIAHENLSGILNRGGIVLCSDIISRSEEDKREERMIFSNFDFEQNEKGYVYVKKD